MLFTAGHPRIPRPPLCTLPCSCLLLPSYLPTFKRIILVPVVGCAGFSRVDFLFSASDAMWVASEHDTKATGFSVGELLPSGAL